MFHAQLARFVDGRANDTLELETLGTQHATEADAMEAIRRHLFGDPEPGYEVTWGEPAKWGRVGTASVIAGLTWRYIAAVYDPDLLPTGWAPLTN